MTSKSLFDNTETAFKLKSGSELERAYFLFKMIANEPLVKIGTAVTKFALNISLPVEGLIRSTVFDHFWQIMVRMERTGNVFIQHRTRLFSNDTIPIPNVSRFNF